MNRELCGDELGARADARIRAAIAKIVGLDAHQDVALLHSFVCWVRDHHWRPGHGQEIDDLVGSEAGQGLYAEWCGFRAWLTESYELSEAKRRGIALYGLFGTDAKHSAAAYLEFRRYCGNFDPTPRGASPKRQTIRVETTDDQGRAGSEIVHLERRGVLNGHPYRASRRRNRAGVIGKETTMMFPELYRDDWRCGATKTTSGRRTVRRVLTANQATKQVNSKEVGRVVLRAVAGGAA